MALYSDKEFIIYFKYTSFSSPRDGGPKEMVSLMARETAPSAAHRDMFVNDTESSTFGEFSFLFQVCDLVKIDTEFELNPKIPIITNCHNSHN